MDNRQDVTGYTVMGMLAMVVMILAPFVLIGGTFAMTRMANASTNMMLVLCGIAAAASWWVSYNAHGFGKSAMALVYEAKYGTKAPWDR